MPVIDEPFSFRKPLISGLPHTEPGNRGKCGFCGGAEQGYAKRDEKGQWKAACSKCANPNPDSDIPQKRKPVGTVFTEDLDTDDKIKERERKKNPGLPPSDYRPKVL